MKNKTILILFAILGFGAISVPAQFGNLKKAIKDKTKTESAQTSPDTTEEKTETVSRTETKNNVGDPNFLFVGPDGMAGSSVSEIIVCAQNYLGANPLRQRFKQWIDELSPTAQEKMFANGKCGLMGFPIKDDQGHKYRNVDSLETLAQGSSAYRVEGGKLVLVKDFAASSMYVVVVPEVNRPGLTLKDLNLGVPPDLKDTYRRKARSVYNYHDLKQALYIFEKYKNYPSPLENNSVLFSASDFETLNKQGKFKGLVVYRLVGDNLVPVK